MSRDIYKYINYKKRKNTFIIYTINVFLLFL